MSDASHSAENLQKLLQGIQGILKSLPTEYSATRCPYSTTHGRLCNPCMQRDAVDAKLYAHLEEVNKLLRIQEEIKQRVNQEHDPFTRHLPVEITSHIFSIYTQGVNSALNVRNTLIEPGPLFLGAICKYWRQVAFSTPHLWNTVNIYIPSYGEVSTKTELTKEWLDRSRQLPLHLSLIFPTLRESTPLNTLFKMLQAVSPRWRELVLEFSPTFYSAFLGEITCAPALESLTLVDNSHMGGYFLLPHTPLLKFLNIQGRLHVSRMAFGWGSLCNIQASVTWGEFFHILRRSEGLESFTLRRFIRDNSRPPTAPLVHSALRELYFEMVDGWSTDPSELVIMLDLLVFPSLEKVRYHCGAPGLFPNSTLHSFFNRSGCRLTHFHLSGHLENSTSDDLISIFSDLPTLTHFKLEDEYIQARVPSDDYRARMSDKLLQRLTPIPRDEFNYTDRLLPRLESLEFVGLVGRKTFSWSCLASLVNANVFNGDPDLLVAPEPERPECINSLRRIYFKVSGVHPTDDDAQTLAQFKKAHGPGIFHCQVFREESRNHCQIVYSFSRGKTFRNNFSSPSL